MSESEVVKEPEVEEWRRSQCSRTRPILVGQYPSSISPSVLNSPLQETNTTSDHHSPMLHNNNNNNETKLSNNDAAPSTTTTKDNNNIDIDIIGVKDELNSASTNTYNPSSTCSTSVKFSQGRTTITSDPKSIKSLTATKNGRHGKEASIPVGIAVAWQRGTSNTKNTTDTNMSCSPGTETEKGTKSTKASSNNKGKSSNPSSPCSSPNLPPKRPLSSNSAPGAIPTKDHTKGDIKNNKLSQSSKISDLKNRPASVNSIPIHQHQHHHHGMSSLQPTNLTAFMKQQQPYALSPYTDWPAGLINVPHLPHNYDNAAYIQQLHHQLQLSHNSPYGPQLAHGGYSVYHGYSPETLQKYEQYLQQSEIHRHHQELQQYHHHQLQQQQQEYEIRRATPIPSPRINIPSPSPISGQTIWPPEFFHQNSSTALSPKSLTSTPSPVLVQDSSPSSHYLLTPTNSAGGKRSTTPTNSTTTTTTSGGGGGSNNHNNGSSFGKNVSFSPVHLPPKKSVSSSWKEVKISPVPKKLKKYDKVDSPIGLDVAKLEEEVRVEEKKTLGGRVKHDFTRLESLIEKRDKISVPLLSQQHQQEAEDEVDDTKKKYFDNNNKKNEKISYPEEKYGDYNYSDDNFKNQEKIYMQATGGDGVSDGRGESPQKIIEIKTKVNRCDVKVDGVGKQVPEAKTHLSLPVVVTQRKLLEDTYNDSTTPPTNLTTITCSSDTKNQNDSVKTVSLMKINDKTALHHDDGDDNNKDKQRSPLNKILNKRDNGKRKSTHDFGLETKCIYDDDGGGIDDDKESTTRDNDSVTTTSKLNRDIINDSNSFSPSTTTHVTMDKVEEKVEPLEYTSKNYNNKNSIYCGTNTLSYNNNNKKTPQVFEEKSDVKVNDTSQAAGSVSSSIKLEMENSKHNDKSFSFSLASGRHMEPGEPHLAAAATMIEIERKPVSFKENENFQKLYHQQQQQIPVGSNSLTTTTTTKCDNDIKVRTDCLSSSNSRTSTYSAISDNSSVVCSRPIIIKKEEEKETKKQETSQLTTTMDAYHQHQYSETGNRSYQLLNVPLPPPLSVDRKLIFKAENQQNHSDTIDKKKLMMEHHTLSQRFQHHFLPIEQEHNHLNLLATVAQEFGNEIGSGSLMNKQGQQHHHQQQPAVDTYEFVEDVQEKIGTFSQSQLALNTSRPSKIKTKTIIPPSPYSSTSSIPTTPFIPTSTTVADSSMSQLFTTTATTTTTNVTPTVPPIVLKIPHITPAERGGKKSRKSNPKSPLTERKSKKKLTTGLISSTPAETSSGSSIQKPKKKSTTPRKKVEPKVEKEKVVKTPRKKGVTLSTPTKMTIIFDASDNNNKVAAAASTTTTGDDRVVIQVKPKSKKQMIQNFVEKQSINTYEHPTKQEEEGMPLNLEKKKSTIEVMTKGNRSSLGSNLLLQNQSKDIKPIELVLPQVQKIAGDKPKKKREKSTAASKLSSSSTTTVAEKSTKRNKKVSLLDDKLIMGGLQEGQSTNKMKIRYPRKKPSEKPNALSQDLTLQNNNDKNIIRNKKNNVRKEKSKKIPVTLNLNANNDSGSGKKKKTKKNTLISNVSSNLMHDDNNKSNILISKNDDNDMTALRIEDCQLFSPTPSSTTSNVENDWAANPTYAVTAIKTNDIDESESSYDPLQKKKAPKKSQSSKEKLKSRPSGTRTLSNSSWNNDFNVSSENSVMSSSPIPSNFSSSVIDNRTSSYLDHNDDEEEQDDDDLTSSSPTNMMVSFNQKDRKSVKPSKLTFMNEHNVNTSNNSESPITLKSTKTTTTTVNNQESEEELFPVKSQLKSFVHFSPRKNKATGTTTKSQQQQQHHIKPCLKAEPILRTATSPERDFISDEEKDVGIENIDLISTTTTTTKMYNNSNVDSSSVVSTSSSRRISIHEDKIHSKNNTNADHDFNHGVTQSESSISENGGGDAMNDKKVVVETSKLTTEGINGDTDAECRRIRETLDKVVIENVSEMLDDMRILTEIQGLFYTGKLNALQPPDVYGVTLDNERGAPPHLIFSAEEVLEKCIREVKPNSLVTGLRICAYWSRNYSGLYPGKVSVDYIPTGDPYNELIPIEFDDGDTGVIKLNEIRLLASDHPIREYDPNPLLTLEKKHRKRRHSSATGSQSGCSGEHEDADCGENFCAKVGKYVEHEEKHRSSHLLYWSWKGLGYKKPRSKKDRNKEFFDGIQRGDEIVNVGDSALFISSGNERPFIGRVEKFWEKKGQKIVSIRWFYHPEEVKTNSRRLQGLKYAGALFESPHIDENDVQTIARKCEVLPFNEFKEKVGCITKLSRNNTSQKGVYYIAGFYDPFTHKLSVHV